MSTIDSTWSVANHHYGSNDLARLKRAGEEYDSALSSTRYNLLASSQDGRSEQSRRDESAQQQQIAPLGKESMHDTALYTGSMAMNAVGSAASRYKNLTGPLDSPGHAAAEQAFYSQSALSPLHDKYSQSSNVYRAYESAYHPVSSHEHLQQQYQQHQQGLSTSPTFESHPTTGPSPPLNEYSVFVGDLCPELREDDLVAQFLNPPAWPSSHPFAIAHAQQAREGYDTPLKVRPAPFTSTKSAKIMTDAMTGASRGYGFVRFAKEEDCSRALREMQGMVIHPMYGTGRPLRVCPATPKNRGIAMPTAPLSPWGQQGFPDTVLLQQHLQHDRVSGSATPTSTAFRPTDTFRPFSPVLPSSVSGNSFPSHSPTVQTYGQDSSNGAAGSQSTSAADPNNTTVFVGGLSSLISEDTLKTFFAPFGEIIYVKIPPGKGCGFVQFVNKHDAERAIERMQGFPIGGGRIRLSWGRSQGDKAAAAAAQAVAQTVQYNHLAKLAGLGALTPMQLSQLASATLATPYMDSSAAKESSSLLLRRLVAAAEASAAATTAPSAASFSSSPPHSSIRGMSDSTHQDSFSSLSSIRSTPLVEQDIAPRMSQQSYADLHEAFKRQNGHGQEPFDSARALFNKPREEQASYSAWPETGSHRAYGAALDEQQLASLLSSFHLEDQQAKQIGGQQASPAKLWQDSLHRSSAHEEREHGQQDLGRHALGSNGQDLTAPQPVKQSSLLDHKKSRLLDSSFYPFSPAMSPALPEDTPLPSAMECGAKVASSTDYNANGNKAEGIHAGNRDSRLLRYLEMERQKGQSGQGATKGDSPTSAS